VFERFDVPVATRAPTGSTNAYLVDGLLLDPAGRTAELDAASERVTDIAVTHTHPDHVGAVAHYAGETDATVWARAGRENRFADATGVTPDRTFREGTDVGPATVVETPGHAPDHVAFTVGREAAVGDLAMLESSVFVGTRDGDMRAYMTSLRRLLARHYDAIHPGHGPAIVEPEIRLTELLAHRRDRERKVEAAVDAGARTVEEVLESAYDKDLTGVRDLAAETVRAHLEKLAVEGRVDYSPSDDAVAP